MRLLDHDGFDLWADGYDQSVQLSEASDRYPFAGYREVLSTVYRAVKENAGNKVLDIGFGTAVLTQRLYRDGYDIYGIDFSEKMNAIAKEKMPNAHLYQCDFTAGLPAVLQNEMFDAITCTYAIHHLRTEQKTLFLKELLAHLNENGQILIGDVAFETAEELTKCRTKYQEHWDSDEIYMVEEDFRELFPNILFNPITSCSGVFTLKRT